MRAGARRHRSEAPVATVRRPPAATWQRSRRRRATRSARRPSVHSARCPVRRVTTARPSPTTPPSGPRPDPLDRPWVHPSELRSFVANPLPPPQARPARVGRSGSRRRSPAWSPPCWCSSRSAPSAAGTARRSRRPSSPTPNDVVDYAVAGAGRASASRRASSPCTAAGDADGTGRVGRRGEERPGAHRAPTSSTGATAVDRRRRATATHVHRQGHRHRPRHRPRAARRAERRPRVPAARPQRRREVGQPVVAVGAREGRTAATSASTSSSRLQHARRRPRPAPTLAGLLETGITTTAETTGGALFDTDGQLVGILTSPPGVLHRPASRCRSGSPRRAGPARGERQGHPRLARRRRPTTTRDRVAAAPRSPSIVPDSPARDGQARGRRRDHPGRRAHGQRASPTSSPSGGAPSPATRSTSQYRAAAVTERTADGDADRAAGDAAAARRRPSRSASSTR